MQKQLNRLPKSVQRRISIALAGIKENPFAYGAIKLKGYENEYRIRVGNYRVRYQVNAEQVVIFLLRVGHRKDVYRN